MKKINFLRTLATAALFSAALLNFSCSKDDDGPRGPEPVDYSKGVYVLAEGNMTSGPGILSLIDEQGVCHNSVYSSENPGHQLGNTCSDLVFFGDNVYILSQNGDNPQTGIGDGILVTADRKSMKVKAAYTKAEFKDLSRPTHIAVIDADKAYIRDGNGISIADLKNHTIKGKITGTEKASQTRMVIKGTKVYAGNDKGVLVIDTATDRVEATISTGGKVLNVIQGPDGNLWALAGSNLKKLAVADNTVAATYPLGVSPSGFDGVGLCVTPSGDTFFFATAPFGSDHIVYKYKTGDAKAQVFFNAKDMITDGNLIYGQLGIHPVTGLLYVPTIKGWGDDYLVNAISIFRTDVAASPVKSYAGIVPFGSGVWFATK